MTKLTLLSKEQDIIGTDRYRANDPAIPMAFRASATMTVNPNADNSNHQVTVQTVKPVVVTDTSNGVTSSPAAFRMTTKFNALQDRTDNVARTKCIEAHIEALTLLKTQIADGMLPTGVPAFTVDL